MEPYFFQENLIEKGVLVLDETVSKHCTQVLRMTRGERIRLTDGNGHLALASIHLPDKKHCTVEIVNFKTIPPRKAGLSIGIGFTKNKTRNEWLLEKLTELGVENIFPIITQHSEREKYNPERYEKILISALIQSQQTYLPKLHEIQKLSSFWEQTGQSFSGSKLIAHCETNDQPKYSLPSKIKKEEKCLILIGPEGDFSLEEIQKSTEFGFIAVHLGKNRLRTETAAVYACAVYNAYQDA